MFDDQDELLKEHPLTLKFVGHIAGSVGLIFLAFGLYFLSLTVFGLFKSNFDGLLSSLIFIAVLLGIGGGLMHTAKRMLDYID